MPQKLGFGGNYEIGRWKANPLLFAQYQMMSDALTHSAVPFVRHARRVLEIGPGPGTWTKMLLEANPTAQYTLVDISKEMLVQARQNLKEQNVSFIESDLIALHSSESFDFVFSSRAVEYMDKQAALAKIASLLVPGGRGVIVTKMPKPFFDRLKNRSISVLHTEQISPTELAHHLKQSGCIVKKVRIATATLPGFNSALANRFVFSLLHRLPLFFPLTLFAESYLVVFQKPL